MQVTVQVQQLFWFFLFFWLSSLQLLSGNSLIQHNEQRKKVIHNLRVTFFG
ncbi:hypothetical protein J2Z65_004835 [Paenibacillus aceris]|uniref:Uncharacterized protein n=1 Tax=Paenibacillus aceris TaxID=869555 RepID=A0ABS4I3V5_9BACL|nr:hypothetical protein [Paenibacillus aceris]